MLWKPALVFGLLMAMFGVSAMVIRHDVVVSPEAAGKAAEFQERIGGVGLGAILVPAWNFSDYDPRLQPVAADSLYPVPGGYSYSPDRLAMVSRFRGEAEK